MTQARGQQYNILGYSIPDLLAVQLQFLKEMSLQYNILGSVAVSEGNVFSVVQRYIVKNLHENVLNILNINISPAKISYWLTMMSENIFAQPSDVSNEPNEK